jgi:DNA-binding PadR family transcriptional regulator
MIELGLLGLLAEQSLHGYELKKQLGELLGSWSLSFGSLYPALNRLERAELVRAVDADALPEPAIPMTGALSGELAAFRGRLGTNARARGTASGRRGKKVYGITDRGIERLDELLLAPGPDDDRSFCLRVAFCGHLAPADRLALFERRKAELIGQLADRRARRAGLRGPNAEAGLRGPNAEAGRRVDPYRRSLRERDARALAHDIAWLDELIDATRADLAEGAPPRARTADAHPSPSLSTLTRPSELAEGTKEGSA